MAGEAVKLLDFRERDIDNSTVSLVSSLQHLGQTVERLRAENKVDIRSTFANRLTLLAGDATTDTNHNIGAFCFDGFPASQLVEYFFLRFLSNAAGV